MKARVKWVEHAALINESGSGHALVVDGSPEIGGRNVGPRPMELLLMSVASCSTLDVIHILRKARQPFTDVQVAAEGTRADSDPKVFTAIHLHFTVHGQGLKEAQVRRAVALSAEKYCSASIMLKRGGCHVTHSVELIIT